MSIGLASQNKLESAAGIFVLVSVKTSVLITNKTSYFMMKLFGARVDWILRQLFVFVLMTWVGVAASSAQDSNIASDSETSDFFVIFQSPEAPILEADEGKGLLDWEVFATADILNGKPREGAKALDERLFEFEVQESNSEDFSEATIRYAGKDSATYVSGLSEGDYYFRVMATHSESLVKSLSDPVQFKVKFVSMELVWKLVVLGITVFFATLWVVVRGGDPIETKDS